MNAEETRIWTTFCSLNKAGKEKAVDYLFDLAELKKYYSSE